MLVLNELSAQVYGSLILVTPFIQPEQDIWQVELMRFTLKHLIANWNSLISVSQIRLSCSSKMLLHLHAKVLGLILSHNELSFVLAIIFYETLPFFFPPTGAYIVNKTLGWNCWNALWTQHKKQWNMKLNVIFIFNSLSLITLLSSSQR